jgi:PAS domain S-box-containing protein
MDSEAGLALLLEGLSQLEVGLTVFNRDLVLVAANRRFQQMLNFPDALCRPGATMERALRHNALQGEYGLGDPEEQVRQRMALSRQFLPHHFERTRPDGSIIEVRGTPLAGGGMVTTYTDVTLERLREQALRNLSSELEQRVEQRTAQLNQQQRELQHKATQLEVVMHHVNQGISYINPSLELEQCNQRFLDLLGFPPELGRPGTPFEAFIRYNAQRGEYGPGDVEQLVHERLVAARQLRGHRFERTRPDGSTLEIIGSPTPEGGFVTTYLDITERKQAEQALNRERLHLRNVLKGTNAGTWEWNVQTGERLNNERWAEITGHTLQELHPYGEDTWRRLCHPQDIERVMHLMQRHFDGETEYYDCEFRMRHKQGHWVWVAAHGQLSSRTPDGKPEWVAGTHVDITERKQAEARIRELNETLEQRVEERTAQLQAAMQTLHRSQEDLARSEAKATLSTLVASVTHELNTPLGNSLMTATTLADQARRFQSLVDAGQLKRSDLNATLAAFSEGSELMQRNLHRAVALMRNFKQVAADQASEQRRQFDLAAAVGEVLDSLLPSLKRQSHQVLVDIPEGIAMDSYPGPLGQVVINLVNNAYLHAFEGREGGVVNLSADLEQDMVSLCVADNGVGMPPELLAHMFQPFFSTKIGRGGTGLGMTIVENLTRKVLGGTLAVQSTVGQGSTFTLRLPRVAPQPKPPEDGPDDG